MLNTSQKLFLKSSNRQLFNPTVIKHRNFDLHVATAKQCGTHWVKYMLSIILSEQYNLPRPDHIMENKIIGHPKTPPKYDHIPQIAVTHSHPHYLLRFPNIFTILNLPKFLVLVRDPRDILVSAYEKAKGDYLNDIFKSDSDIDFSTFLRADMDLRKPFADIASIILFYNSWGSILDRQPENTKLIKYEDLKSHTEQNLKIICEMFGFSTVSDHLIRTAIAESSRSKMKKKLDPNEDQAEKSVNLNTRNFKDWYNKEDKEFINSIFSKHLKYNFNYDLNNWNK